jgi:hypothetical protein
VTSPTARARVRAAALGLLLVGGLAASVAAVPAAHAGNPAHRGSSGSVENSGALHLRQSDDCSGPDVAPGSRVNLPFSIAFTGFVPNQVGVFSLTAAGGATSSNRFSVGDTGTTCSAMHGVAEGGFLATFSYTDNVGAQHSPSISGVVTGDPVDPSPSDTSDPWASPTATASPTASPGTEPSRSPAATSTRTSSTPLPSTGGGSSGGHLASTGADPRLVILAISTTVAGILLYLAASLPVGRRQR